MGESHLVLRIGAWTRWLTPLDTKLSAKWIVYKTCFLDLCAIPFGFVCGCVLNCLAEITELAQDRKCWMGLTSQIKKAAEVSQTKNWDAKRE